jgi:outer membrane biosynthesis protein TonB
MNNIQHKAIQIGGYLRIMAIAIAVIATLICGSKAFAIAPHMPDVALQAEVDMHRESVERSKDRKAAEKCSKHKEHKEKHKDRDKKTPKPKKEKGKKKTPKPKKEKKPPRPTKEDRKRDARDRARNLNRR